MHTHKVAFVKVVNMEIREEDADYLIREFNKNKKHFRKEYSIYKFNKPEYIKFQMELPIFNTDVEEKLDALTKDYKLRFKPGSTCRIDTKKVVPEAEEFPYREGAKEIWEHRLAKKKD